MGKVSRWGKRAVASGTVAAVGLTGGAIGWHFWEQRGRAGAHGAVVDLGEENGMLLRDLRGRPAFINYFDSNDPEKMKLTVSISTTQAMPHTLSDKLSQLTKFRQTDVSRKVPAEDYRPIDEGSADIIRQFFREFTELTGIKVEVRENASNADITIGGYVSHDNYIGFASFPQEIPELRHLPQNRGFMMLDTAYLKQKLEQGNPQAVLALVSHEFGHNFGLLHPHDALVHTAMNTKQRDAVARMAYNNHTFPPIAGTSIDTGYGPLDIYLIRDALRDLGIEPPRIHPDNDTYLLSDLAEQQRQQARAKSGWLGSMPALSILDNGGHNTLEGTSGDDLLVTESGYCGLLKRDEKKIELTKDGQPYCLVEGEFSVIRSGAGDDLILTARGTEQTVYLGTGRNDVAILYEDMGDKTLVPLPVEDDRNLVEKALDAVDEVNPLTEDDAPEQASAETSRHEDDTVTLTLHQSLLRATDAVAYQNGDDIQVNFYAMSGREVGSITLQGQATENRGITTFRIIDDNGADVASYDVAELHDAESWQKQVITPALEKVDSIMMDEMRADIAKTRQALAGTAGAWTTPDEPPVEVEDQPVKPGKGNDHRPVAPNYPNDDDKKDNHVNAVLRRRRNEEQSNGIFL